MQEEAPVFAKSWLYPLLRRSCVSAAVPHRLKARPWCPRIKIGVQREMASRWVSLQQYKGYTAAVGPSANHPRPNLKLCRCTHVLGASKVSRYKQENERARSARRKQETALAEVMRKRQEVSDKKQEIEGRGGERAGGTVFGV